MAPGTRPVSIVIAGGKNVVYLFAGTAVLVLLRLVGLTDWSWYLVLAPVLFPFVVFAAFLFCIWARVFRITTKTRE